MHIFLLILTDKLFCGKCGAPMVGKSGYGRHGGKYNYYVCSQQIKHACDKKPVRRDDIEEAVIANTMELLLDQTVFDFIVDATWNYYLETNNQKKEIERIEKNIRDVEIAIGNLIRSVEQGMPYDLVKSRIEELNGEKIVLAATLADKKVSSQMELTRDHIVFFLEQFRNLDYKDRNCQKKLIATFVNSVYLYDDKLVIGYNYSDQKEQVPLLNIDEGVRTECAMPCSHKHIRTYLYRNVLAIEMRW